jgi:hypothetical protein
MVPSTVATYIYMSTTGNTNLRNHLYEQHAEEYDKAILEYKWSYKLSNERRGACTQNTLSIRDRALPSFSPKAFLDQLVRFIVADDQVSPDGSCVHSHSHTSPQSIRVVECPEFRRLCMVLCQTLVDSDIPRRDKMRETVISQWRDSFEELKSNLSVGIAV